MTISKKDERWMSLANKLKESSTHPNYKMCALIIAGHKLLNIGLNSLGGPAPFYKNSKGKGRHAETNALLNLERKTTKGATIYIAGRSKCNFTILTRPCEMCMEEIKRMKIKYLCYHTINGDIIKEKI